MPRELPTGTVTFRFTDVEGSTRPLEELGAERYAEALSGHPAIVRDALARHGGVEVDTQGDARRRRDDVEGTRSWLRARGGGGAPRLSRDRGCEQSLGRPSRRRSRCGGRAR